MHVVNNRAICLEDLIEESWETEYNLYKVIMEEFREYVMDNGYTNNDIDMDGSVHRSKPSAYLTVWVGNDRKFQVSKPGKIRSMRQFSIKKWMCKSHYERIKLYSSILQWIFKK